MHVRANPFPLLLPLALAACTAAGGPPADELRAPETPAGGPAQREEPLQQEPASAVEAIRRGDYEGAHTILARLLFNGHLADARAALAAGSPEDALLDTEAALKLFPKDEGALLLDARASLALAEAAITESRPFARETVEDALAAYQRAGASPEARLGAARAAYLLGRSAEALALAREGIAALDGKTADLDRLPQRIYAEAAYAAYSEGRADPGLPAEQQKELFSTTETALTSLLGREMDDPWAHLTLAYLYEWEERPADARDVLVRAVYRLPRERALVDELAKVASKVGGAEGGLAVFEPFAARYAEVPLAHWYDGLFRYELALARYGLAVDAPEPKDFPTDAFRQAEASFARCRALAPEFEETCINYELICRNGAGWCLYRKGDVEGARAAFHSMEELREGGLEWQLEGRLLSGVLGLAYCAQAYVEGKEFIQAAELNDFLRGYAPGEPAYANNAGFMFRDAAIELEHQGQRLCRAARGEIKSPEALAELRALAGLGPEVAAGSAAEREALRAASDARMARARELMQRSAVAYRAAAELAPEDVRIVNDAAVVLVYYLHEDVERARAMLERCDELAARQIESADLDDEARKDLRTAWGDVHQNLGVLHTYYTGDKAAAIAEFEESLKIDPEPRAEEVQELISAVRGQLDPLQSTLWTKSWGEPCR